MDSISKSPLEQTAMRILGEDFYALADFFLSIHRTCFAYEKENKPVLAAFVTRRCHVLSLIFQNIFSECADEKPKKDWLSVYTKGEISAKKYREVADAYYTTDTNIVCQGGGLADYYQRTGELPHILIVDEMLLHGRTLNHILTSLEHSILTALQVQSDRPVNAVTLQNEFVSKLEIRMFIQNNEPLLLLSRYQMRLWSDSIRTVSETRERSKQFALLVSVSNVNNNSYSWSIVRRPRPPEPVWGSGARKLVTTQASIRQTTYFWAYPSKKSPKAIFTFRWKHSNLSPEEKENYYLGVPFAVMGDIPLENSLKLYEQIMQDVPFGAKFLFTRYIDPRISINKVDNAYWRRISEFNELVLCGLFTRKLYGGTLTAEDLDLDMLARNLTNFSEMLQNRVTFDDPVCDELKALWEFTAQQTEERLTSYLEILLADTTPLWEMEKEWVDVDKKAECLLEEVINDEISELGYRTEQNAREIYKIGLIPNEKRLSSWGVKCFLAEKLKEIIDYYCVDEPAVIYTMLAILLQQMDLGVVSIAPGILEAKNGQRQESLELRAGEQSLFIKPIQYQRYIPILKRIKNRWETSWSDIEKEIDHFTERLKQEEPDIDDNLALDLKLFLYQMSAVEQNPEDWDFPLVDSAPKWEFDGSVPPPDRPGRKMLEGMKDQQKLLRLYNQI